MEEIYSVTRRKPQETFRFSRIFDACHSAKSSNRVATLKICPAAASSPLTVAKLCPAVLSLHLNKFSCAKTISSLSMDPNPVQWNVEKSRWPNSNVSRFIETDAARWHVQRLGVGPKLLLLHGSGATTHSFDGLIANLKNEFEIIALDLPGHGFSSELKRLEPTLPNVARAISEVLEHEDFEPDLVIGHSAGAAIGVELIHRDLIAPKALVAINGAFYPFPGFAGSFFPAMAKLLFLNPFVPSLFSVAASKSRVARLMESTGSTLTHEQIGYYERALASSAHIRGTLAMMANWQLETMREKLRRLHVPTQLIIGGNDGTIAPEASLDTEKSMQNCRRVVLAQYGHLVHEEAPEKVVDAVRDFWSQTQEQAA